MSELDPGPVRNPQQLDSMLGSIETKSAGDRGATIFVGNLSWSTSEERVRETMETVAPVRICELQWHGDSGRSKGWGLVEFETIDGAERAMQLLNGAELDGRRLFLRLDRTAVEKEEGYVVFVGNLPWDATAETLSQIFHAFEPYDVHIKTNMAGKSRGFGLLRFNSVEQAQAAIAQVHGSEVGGRRIQVRLDRAHLELMGKAKVVEISDTVTCGNIPWHTQDAVLACHMAQAGRVIACQVQRHSDTLRSKGWAVVRYISTEEAANAVRQLHRSVLDGRSLNVRFYKPIRREMEEEAAAEAMMQHHQHQQQQQQPPGPHMQLHMSPYHSAQQHYSQGLMAHHQQQQQQQQQHMSMGRRHVMRGLH